MLFTTDQQTIDDLNVFGRPGGDSLYSLFNRCTTVGGAAILEEMFRHPLSTETAINRRSGTIQFFAAGNVAFPFESMLFDAAEPYLANADERSRLSAEDYSVVKALSNVIGTEVETQQIYNGIGALVALVQSLHAFIEGLDVAAGHVYFEAKQELLHMLADPALKPVLAIAGKLSRSVLVEFDTVFRFRKRELLQKLLSEIYQLDIYLAIGKVARERGFIFPTALAGGSHQLQLEGLFHPRVANAVPNNIQIKPDGNVIFLTGANMAGKSTFMKSLSTAVFLAHMGFPVAASKMEFAVLDGMYTTINLPDNLGMGASHFYAEVLRVKKIAHELAQNKKLFIVFDELFRGTNVKDAHDATIAITEGFAKRKNSIFVISTHIIEAGEILKQRCANVRFLYLPTRMQGNHPVYSYTLEKGITDDRHGMIIINNEGILDILKHGTGRS